jgi:hypothetical protein
MFCGKMGDESIDSDERISKMFSGKNSDLTSDEQLALHLIHRFNLKRDTLETMPAFDEHLKLLFPKEKQK